MIVEIAWWLITTCLLFCVAAQSLAFVAGFRQARRGGGSIWVAVQYGALASTGNAGRA